MSGQGNAPVIIYKKVKKVSGDGHHGGAWKVAYADFVTAMMAFFLLMWLLNATTEQQRKGISDYFAPTIPVNRISGGGDGALGGDSVFTEETLAQSGTGGMPSPSEAASDAGDEAGNGAGKDVAHAAEEAAFAELEEMLTGKAGESMVSELTGRHIVTELTDEGLIIEIFDTESEPLFEPNSAKPTALMEEISGMMARVFSLVQNGVAVEAHVRSQPVVVAQNTSWEVSGERADAVRKLLSQNAFPAGRVQRVTGHADRKPAARNPMAIRNNRVELILLRSKR
ncbi:MAG: flagellar motor protein MotB [Maritimibacter sp.]